MYQLTRHFLPHEVCVWLASLMLSKHAPDMPNAMRTWSQLGLKHGQLSVDQVAAAVSRRLVSGARFCGMSQLIRYFLRQGVYPGHALLMLSKRTQHMQNTMCTRVRAAKLRQQSG